MNWKHYYFHVWPIKLAKSSICMSWNLRLPVALHPIYGEWHWGHFPINLHLCYSYFLDTEIPSFLVLHFLSLRNPVSLSVAAGLPFSAWVCLCYLFWNSQVAYSETLPYLTREGKFISLSSQFSLFFLSLGCLPVCAFTFRHSVIISLQWRNFFHPSLLIYCTFNSFHSIYDKNNNYNQSGSGYVPGFGQLFYIQYM